MSDQHDVRRIAMAMPEATEKGNGFRVGGKLFVWFYPERVHPKKPRVINLAVAAMAVATLEDKGALLAGDPETFFTTDHYDGYKAVLVRLERVGVRALRKLIGAAWAAAVPPALRTRLEGAPARRSTREAPARGRSKTKTQTQAKDGDERSRDVETRKSLAGRAKRARARQPRPVR